MQRDTRRYAKRQLTWFRRQENAEWFAGTGDDPEIQRAAVSWAAQFLKE